MVSEDFSAVLADGALSAEIRPPDGETPMEFARRVSRDAATAQEILRLPGEPSRERITKLPYASLSNELKRAVVTALFPSDLRATTGWLHIAVEDEELTAVADWFSGKAANGPAIASANALSPGTLPRGATVRIPTEYLLPPFRDAEVVVDEPVSLEFGEDAKGRFAVYRLRRKEALYSAVVVRFTGRLHSDDVIELALKIAERSAIEDVHGIPIGYPVKIPLDVLSPEFLPKDDPKAEALRREKAEATQFSAPVPARGLAGVRVIVDAGHGGRDTGTLHAGVWESTYVYDVACRLRKLLLSRTKADVVMTTKEPDVGWSPPDKDRLANRRNRLLLTNPAYQLGDPVLGVNLRWYLANALLKRSAADKKKIGPEKTVFISIHADSLHPSVRGAMVYVPGERFLRDRYGKSGTSYTRFEEFRDQPVVAFNKKERVSAEGQSTALAEKILAAMRGADVPVHRFSPVRTHVIRGGREWVPAVLRYNRIPNRVLLEISNLGNEEDRALTVTKKFREKVAEAVLTGLVEFFGGDESDVAPGKKAPEARPVKVASQKTEGPDQPLFGPWPEPISPSPSASRRK